MRIPYVPILMVGALCLASAASAGTTQPMFIRGHTTVTETQQIFGAPMDTSMAPDGALTLLYPASRLASRVPLAAGTTTVSLCFATDFKYQTTILHRAQKPSALAAR
jgi:hypothetical protein